MLAAKAVGGPSWRRPVAPSHTGRLPLPGDGIDLTRPDSVPHGAGARGLMRHARTGTDTRQVVVVGTGMATLSTLVAALGLTVALPDVVYRVAAGLGGVVESAVGDDGDSRSTPLRGSVVLTPAERAALAASPAPAPVRARRGATPSRTRPRGGAGSDGPSARAGRGNIASRSHVGHRRKSDHSAAAARGAKTPTTAKQTVRQPPGQPSRQSPESKPAAARPAATAPPAPVPGRPSAPAAPSPAPAPVPAPTPAVPDAVDPAPEDGAADDAERTACSGPNGGGKDHNGLALGRCK